MSKLVLHNYFRSSASFRVRIALNLKKIPYDYRAYHLRKGEQAGAQFQKLSRQGLVPALELESGRILTQSLAIVEYLEETQPKPALLPSEATARAYVREISHAIAMDIHPINNLRVLASLRSKFSADEAAVSAWVQQWVHITFEVLEFKLASSLYSGDFCYGDSPTMADLCLVPQCFNNQRFGIESSRYPKIAQIFERCMREPAFQQAAPAVQPDAEA